MADLDSESSGTEIKSRRFGFALPQSVVIPNAANTAPWCKTAPKRFGETLQPRRHWQNGGRDVIANLLQGTERESRGAQRDRLHRETTSK